MSDQQFFAFLDSCRQELAVKQTQFQQRTEKAGAWHYDLSRGFLTLGAERFPITPVGTHSSEQQSWLWAWANDAFPDVARDASKTLQFLHRITGFRVFLDPGIKASSKDAQDFTALAVHQLGAIGFFRAASGEAALYLAVYDPLEISS